MVNIALIGYGYWGPNLARNLQVLRGAKLVACCELDASRLALAHNLYPHAVTTPHVAEIWHDAGIEAVVLHRDWPARTAHAVDVCHLLASRPESCDILARVTPTHEVRSVGGP